jgi:hypothetical protein
MPSLHQIPDSEHYFKATRKGDTDSKAIAVNKSPVRALADASQFTGLPRDCFEIYEISKEEFEELRPR